MKITIGKLRDMQQCASPRGPIAALARSLTEFFHADAPLDWFKTY